MDINTGLPGNSIKVVKKDNKQRLWIGTENGLIVLNNSDPYIKSIVSEIKDHPVWTLDFYKNYALIGTRFHGLYIYDLETNQLAKHFDTSVIGQCRRLKVLKDTVFVASKKAPYFVAFKNKHWVIGKIKSTITSGFFSDFVQWENRVYAVVYDLTRINPLYQFRNDSLIATKIIKSNFQQPSSASFLCANSNDSLLVLAGDGFCININHQGIEKINYLYDSKIKRNYPFWDIGFANNRMFLASGNALSEKDGMIYEPEFNTINDLNKAFYGQSFYYDNNRNGMWIGTINKGLFYWPFMGTSYQITNGATSEFRIKLSQKEKGIVYNNQIVYSADFKSHIVKEIFRNDGTIKYPVFQEVMQFGDTTSVLTYKDLILLKGDIKIRTFQNVGHENDLNNVMYKKDHYLYLFSIVYDSITKVDLIKGIKTKFKSVSNQVKPLNYLGNLFYFSDYTGFHYFDSTSHSFNFPSPIVQSFTIHNDTLWVLNAGILSSYQIDFKRFTLKPLIENNIGKKLPEFVPSWVIDCNGKLLTGDNKGIFKVNSKTGELQSYTYIGNYSQGKPPVTDGENLYFNHLNYITKINVDSLIPFLDVKGVDVQILPNGTIYQNTPFIIHFISNDYLTQKHSLKTITIQKGSKVIREFYTLTDHFEFSNGIEKGDYSVVFKINGIEVAKRELSISIPLTENPLFYLGIICIVIIVFLIIFKSMLNKRAYDKHILQNRLELLKQNLNPHFVFNSLNLIYSLVLQQKNDAAIKTIANFSDLHRYYLDNINKPKITLIEELHFVESYLKLQAERVESDNPIVYYLPEKLDKNIESLVVPTMILQPLIENAVKYCGVDKETTSFCTIWVDVTVKENSIIVGVENTIGINETPLISGSGAGLRLVAEKIDIFNKTYNRKISMNLETELIHCKTGYRVELRF